MSNSVFRIFVGERSLYSRIPKTFFSIPYEEQYENRDFSSYSNKKIIYKKVSVPSLKDLDNNYSIDLTKLPKNLTISENVSQELMKIINNDYSSLKKHEIAYISHSPRTSPW